MKVISILHIGDIHYPELATAERLADVKSGSIPSGRLDRLAPRRMQEICRQIVKVANGDTPVVGAICTGDLTSRGKFEGYTSAISLLTSMFYDCRTRSGAKIPLVVVPGNHDIDRNAIKINADPFEKFETIERAWESVDCEQFVFRCREPSPFHFASETGEGKKVQRIALHPINTCLLSGEYFGFPEGVRQRIQEEVLRHGASIGEESLRELLAEQIDCPAVDRSHVEAIRENIQNSDPSVINIVAGHHPLLPQATPRIDGYVELVNGGYIREALFNTQRTLLYLHGHIHQAPIHSLENKACGDNKIVHVSAPELKDGFNQIKFYLADSSQALLGMEILPFRFVDSSGLWPANTITVRLLADDAIWSEVDGAVTEILLRLLTSPDRVFRFGALVDGVAKTLKTKSAERAELLPQEISVKLKLLRILEVVDIININSVKEHWQVRRRSI